MRYQLRFLGVVFAFLCTSAAFAQARVEGGVVNGDSNNPVAGLTVHLVNKSLKPTVDIQQVTNGSGRYIFDDVAPADGYAVDVYDQTGKLVGSDVRFDVAPDSRHAAIPDIDIARGVTAERTEQSGGLVETDRSVSPGANISNEQLRLLPLYNRNFLALGLIQPEVHDVEPGSPLQGAAFSIAGSRSTSTYFLLDGVDNVASSSNQAIPFQVNEAVREFRVTYSTPSLRYGQGSGGIVDIITSSGDTGRAGHAWHGSLFGYFNNDALNADNPLSVYSNSGFAKASAYANGSYLDQNRLSIISAAGTGETTCVGDTSSFCGYSPQTYNALVNLVAPGTTHGFAAGVTQLSTAGTFNPAAILSSSDSFVQPVSQEQFGGSVGGKIGSLLYLFASYEGTRINNPTPIFERVPTGLDRTGLPATLNAGDKAISQSVLSLFPAANVGQTGGTATPLTGTNAGIFGFYRGTAPNYTNVSTVQLRPDFLLKTPITARYTGQLLDQLHDDTLPAGGAYPGNGADRRAQNQSAAISYTSTFGHANRNLLSLAFTQYRVDEVAQDRGFNASALGLAPGATPTIVISGVDNRTSGAAPGQPGLVGGWDDSFWQTCVNGGTSSNCATSSAARSPSPITPSLDGDFPLARIGAPLAAPSKRRDSEAFISDAVELQLSPRNQLTVGGDYRYQQNFSYDGGFARGLVVSNNIGEFTSDSETCISCSAALSPTGEAFAHPSFDYELRQPTGYTGDLRSSSFGAFAEHTVKIKDRLTLVGGVRYDYFGQPLDTQNRLWNYNVDNQGLNRQGATGTFDAFDYQCGGGTTFLDSLYGSLRASTPPNTPAENYWACNTAGKFELPQNKTDLTGMLGLSYAPDADYHQVIRVAVGGYYDHLPASYNQKLLLNRPDPFNVNNPGAIYGQNFASSYTSATCQSVAGQASQCGFGLSTLNFSNLAGTAVSTFQNYQAASSANILYARDPKALQTPYTIQFNTSYQYRFSGSWMAELGYVGSVGQRLPLVYDGNYANEFYCQQDAYCNNDTYFPVFTESHIGASNYNSVVLRTEGRLWHGLSMHGSYTFAKSLDNIAGSTFPGSNDSLFTQLYGRQLYGLGNPAAFDFQANGAAYGLRGKNLLESKSLLQNLLQSANIPSFDSIQSALTTTGTRIVNVSHYSLPQDPTKFSSAGAAEGADYGPSDFDVRHRGVADFVYSPLSRSRMLKGFTLSGITTIQSGEPFTIFSGPAYGQVAQLANNVKNTVHVGGGPGKYISGLGLSNLPSVGSTICPSLYAQPTLYSAASTPGACTGNSSRNEFTGPAYFTQDLALQKATTVHEGQSLILRAEFYNVFNRANYYNPISELSTDGVHINPEFGLIRSAHDPLEIQFSGRFLF